MICVFHAFLSSFRSQNRHSPRYLTAFCNYDYHQGKKRSVDISEDMASVVVLGAGVIGASSAVFVKEALPDVDVTLLASEFTPDTTGDGAAGVWEPFVLEDTPMELQRKWSKITYDWFFKLMKRDDSHKVGISKLSGYHLCDKEIELPGWHDAVPSCRMLSDREMERIPPKYKSGYTMVSFTCEPLYYLPFLMKRFHSLGGKCIKRKINSFEELHGSYDIVINCTGMGARELCNDPLVIPVRGQVMRVKAPWIKQFYLNDLEEINSVAYIIPNLSTVVLGGTTQYGNFSVEVNKEDREHILRETILLEPSLKNAEIVSEWAGLRPSRSAVRLEIEKMKFASGNSINIIHNYGHGGAGITIHWGCAEDVCKLTKELLEEMNKAGGTLEKSKLSKL